VNQAQQEERMKKLRASLAGLALCASAGTASADGELAIYNWGNYTSPELVKKFEETYKVKVTVTDYDSNDTALAKVRAGGHGFDIVVPSANYVPIWIEEGLLLEARPDQMENFKNVDPRWIDVPWDPGRRYTVPWQWFMTGVLVDTAVYKGDINTTSIWLDPPPELVGKIDVTPEMNEVMYAAIRYMGGEWCTDDKALLKKVRDKLKEAKPKWLAMDYEVVEKFAKKDYAAALYWNGAAFRAREQNSAVRFGYPKEGFPYGMDSVAILKDAKNVENAKLFMNFIMTPENAALISDFATYANGIMGSEQFMRPGLKDAPELSVPDEFQAAGEWITTCPPEVNEVYSKIWKDLLK
jgi:spermidine/putrescine transport system substrate-binding protein